jgi:hypothetical protein
MDFVSPFASEGNLKREKPLTSLATNQTGCDHQNNSSRA